MPTFLKPTLSIMRTTFMLDRRLLLLALAAAGAGCSSARSSSRAAEVAPVDQLSRNDPYFVEVVPRPAAQRVDVLVGGRPFTSYIYPASLKKPVLYPLRTATGTVITRGYPLDPRAGERVDHPHHAGLWFNYGNVNGLDFWNNSTAIKEEDAPRMGTILHRSVNGTRSGVGEGTLDVTTEWVDYRGRALLREDTRYVFRAKSDLRSIDRLTTLTALGEPVLFKDDKEGVIGMRVARALEHPSKTPEKFTDASGRATAVAVLDNTGVTGKYLSSEGKEGDDVWGTRGRWATLSGIVNGEPVRVAILDHPKNPGFPTYWHARGYGLFAANPLGQKILSNGKDELNLRLAPGQSTTFRHQVLIMTGPTATQNIEPYYDGFTR
jgi:hypothetical protein